MLNNKTHVPYEDFLEHVNLITLKDSRTIKKSFRNSIKESKKEIPPILNNVKDSPEFLML